jgi:imidazole glycerol-phosphate synthase subunit HisH
MPDSKITVIDLDIGNLTSVAHAFRRVGADVRIVSSAAEAGDARALVLPGVGAFQRAMDRLQARGFGPLLQEHVSHPDRSLIGICLGMQLLADRSHEHGLHAGLGLIAGEVVRLEPSPPDFRVPNIGWMPVHAARRSPMFPAGVDGESFYHVHSYHLACHNPSEVAATIDFAGRTLVTAVERGNIFGVQFHPEKSQEAGLNLLSAVLAWLRERAN